MQESSITAALAGRLPAPLDTVRVLDEIDSTNSEASRLLKQHGAGSRLLVARAQTAGRGRRGRDWVSPMGSGIYMSLTRCFTASLESLQPLSLVTALAVRHCLAQLAGEDLHLKWPNDILCGNKKLAGILLESESVDGQQCIIFGIGINLRLTEPQRQQINRPVTDLAALAESPPEAEAVVVEVAATLLEYLARFAEAGFAEFQDEWNRFDRYRDKDVVIASGKHRTIGKSRGVDASGELVLSSAQGTHSISAGEIFPSLREAEAAD